MKNWAKFLIATGLFISLVGTFYLYLGSLDKPWGIQTWDGSSTQEQQLFKLQRRQVRIGLSLLGAGFVLQFAGVVIAKT